VHIKRKGKEPMVKKKVSFDIDPKLLSDIKKFCSNKSIKLADFFRGASQEKLDNDNSFITIFVAHEGKIEKYLISKEYYTWDMYSASDEMKINADAECEGYVRIKREFVLDEEKQVAPTASKSELNELIASSKERSIAFYTKVKYCDN